MKQLDRMMKYAVILAATALSACSSHWDMQGNDPTEYYAAHPIKNTVETRTLSVNLHFAPQEVRLSNDESEKLRAALHYISPSAVDSVRIVLPSVDMCDRDRPVYMTRLMHSLGYSREQLIFAPSSKARDTAEITVTYATVVAPRCPDWRTSPVTSYSNTYQGNFECAQEVNLGLMIADPHDLVHGTGDVDPDVQRDSKTLDDYHAGKDFSQSGQQGSSGGGGSSNSGSANGNPANGEASAVASGVAGLTGGGSSPQ